MGFRALKDFTLFLLVFSFINDNFLVDIAGGAILKVIFAIFIAVNIVDIAQAFIKFSNRVLTSFYMYVTTMVVIMLVTVLFYGKISIADGVMVLLPMTVIFVYISQYENFERLLYFIWISVIVSAIISLFNEPINQWTFRRSGGTVDPNEFSAHLLAAISITIFLFYKNRNYIFLFGSIALFLYALLYAGSKTAMLTIFILAIYAIYTKFNFVIKKIFSFKGFIGFLILAAVLSQLDLARMEAVVGLQERAQDQGTADTRFVSWEAGWRMAQDNFLLGVGFDLYEDNSRDYALDYIADGSLAAHNVFIKLLAEAGIFAFALFVLFLYLLFTTKYKEIANSEYYWIYLAALANIFMGLTLSSTYEKYFWMFLALLSHVIVILYSEQKRLENENTTHTT